MDQEQRARRRSLWLFAGFVVVLLGLQVVLVAVLHGHGGETSSHMTTLVLFAIGTALILVTVPLTLRQRRRDPARFGRARDRPGAAWALRLVDRAIPFIAAMLLVSVVLYVVDGATTHEWSGDAAGIWGSGLGLAGTVPLWLQSRARKQRRD